MAWTVILEDENRTKVKALDSEFEFLSSILVDQSRTKLLKYLDPYGDTMFNHLQMNDLISDLRIVLQHDPENPLIKELMHLANHCANETHLYLIFYGD